MSRLPAAGIPTQKVRVVTLQIDGQDFGAREDESILQVAADNGIRIPSLCYLEGLSTGVPAACAWSKSRAVARLLSACTTRVAERACRLRRTATRSKRYRRMILELLFAERNHVCSVCVSNGHCELQDLAMECGMDHVRVPYRNTPYHVDSSHDLFRVDHNRCVLCTRCVRVCDEIEGRAHVGCHGTRRRLPGDHRLQPALGR